MIDKKTSAQPVALRSAKSGLTFGHRAAVTHPASTVAEGLTFALDRMASPAQPVEPSTMTAEQGLRIVASGGALI
ncbi:MAG: hypothetical protein AAGJ32_07675 [Pseudomonadota bacterium]